MSEPSTRMEEMVIIIGAGPAGLATSACLNCLNIPNVVLEKDDCYAPLWKKRVYDRLKLHLAKQFCELPFMPYPSDAPTFIPKNGFINYLDNYVLSFDINPKLNNLVKSAFYDEATKRWVVLAKDTTSGEEETYFGKFLVVATGENNEGLIPEIPGLDHFQGLFMHSSKYDNGKEFKDKDVLVVGCGNSGMEIAFDLYNWGSKTSIVARSPVHVVTKEIVFLGMSMLRFFPCEVVDFVTVLLSWFKFGDTAKYGIRRPSNGPFKIKGLTGRSPTIDVGAMEKIQTGEIKVLPPITNIKGKAVNFENGLCNDYDVIVFATGYKSAVRKWLKDGDDLFSDNGMPKQTFPNHWKGKNGIYCAGFGQMGLVGIANDAKNIASDISMALAEY